MSRGKLVLRDIEERKDFFDDCLSMAVLTFNHLLDHFSVLFPTRFIVVLASLVLAMFAKIAGPLPGLGTDELQQLQEIRLVKQSFQVLLDIDKFSRCESPHNLLVIIRTRLAASVDHVGCAKSKYSCCKANNEGFVVIV